jgi:hypothetical protein
MFSRCLALPIIAIGIIVVLIIASFTAYIIQVPVVVFLSLSFQSIQLPLLVKFAIVSPIGISLCFLFAYLIQKIPKADRIL